VEHNHVLSFHVCLPKDETEMPKRVIVADANQEATRSAAHGRWGKIGLLSQLKLVAMGPEMAVFL
jgi:hypothetical protein